MSARIAARRRAASPRQGGFVLIAALLMLVILTLLGVSMMSGTSLQQKMASNTREKIRATTAAAAVVRAVEQAISTQNLSVSANCATTSNAWRVCPSGTLTTATAVANSTWGLSGGASNATPASAPALNLNFPVNASGGQNIYAVEPRFFIEYLGRAPTPPGYSASVSGYGNRTPVVDIYETTAMATGGNLPAVSVIQSIYKYMHMQ